MRPAHIPPPCDGVAPETIRYAHWKNRVQMATDLDQLVNIVSAYLAEWRPEDVQMLPRDICVSALGSAEEIPLRAVIAAQAELKTDPALPDAGLLREMALTLTAAATRLRFLGALRTRESRR